MPHPATAKKGAAHLPSPKKKQRFVAVEDVLPKARILHKYYLDARDAFVKWSAEPDQSAKRYIAQWCEGLAKNEKFKKRIDVYAIEKDKQEYEETAARIRANIEDKAKALREALNDPKLKRQLKSMGAEGVREGAALVQGMGESLTGGSWIERELSESGEGILSWILSKEGAEKSGETVEAVKKPFEVIEPVLDALAEAAGTVVRLQREKAVEYVAHIISVRFNVRVGDLITRQAIEIRGGMTAAVVYRREITVLQQTTLLSGKAVEKFGKGLEAFGRLVAALNFAAKVNLLVQDPSFKNAMSTVGSLAELLETSETVASLSKKLLRYGREVAEDGAPRALEVAGEAAEVAQAAGSAGRTFLEFLGKSVAKKLTPLAVVAGVADTITGSMEAYDEVEKGNYAGATAKMAVAAGGLLIAAAGILEVSGLLDATGVGAPAGLVLGIVGLLVGAAGAIAGLFTGESELEAWADHCQYGMHAFQHKYGAFEGHLDKQIEALTDAVYTVKVKGEVKQDVSHVEIEPTGLTKASKMTCFVNASGGLTMAGARQELPVRDDQPDCAIEFAGNEIKKIKLRLQMPFVPDVTWTKLTVNCTLDPDGDGSSFKRSATIERGFMDWVWSKL
jgi:hypothetical protein